MPMFNQHPSIFYSLTLTDLGFDDCSWINESCGRLVHKLEDGRLLVIWVEHEDPSLREYDCEKYAVQIERDEDSYGTDDYEELGTSETFDGLLEIIKPYV